GRWRRSSCPSSSRSTSGRRPRHRQRHRNQPRHRHRRRRRPAREGLPVKADARIRTMVVDDEPNARQGLRVLLESDPEIEVVGTAADGAEAVKAIRAIAPDLVFLDVQMPEIDGFGVIERVGPSRMPAVVFVTAWDRYALRAFDVHALDYLVKPFD